VRKTSACYTWQAAHQRAVGESLQTISGDPAAALLAPAVGAAGYATQRGLDVVDGMSRRGEPSPRQLLRRAGVQQFGRRCGQAPRERVVQLMDRQVPGERNGIALHVGEHTW
jgi:hypothetical protein